MKCQMCGRTVKQEEADEAAYIATTDVTLCVSCAKSLDTETDAEILGISPAQQGEVERRDE